MQPVDANPQPTDQDRRNAASRQAVAERQLAAWKECLRLADAALGPGWVPWMRITAVDSDHRRTGDETPIAVAYKVRAGKGDDRAVRYLRQGPDGIICSDRYEDVFGSLVTELHPTKTVEVRGQKVPVPRWQLYWSGLDLYEPRSADALAAARITRERNKAAREQERYEREYPLFAEIERQEKERGR
jgi:hypothetical protein